jgi:hypothetical protein
MCIPLYQQRDERNQFHAHDARKEQGRGHDCEDRRNGIEDVHDSRGSGKRVQ